MQKSRANEISNFGIIFSLSVLALALRLLLFYIPTNDLVEIGTWYDTFIKIGRIDAFKEIFYGYNPPLLYLIDIMTMFRFIPKEIAIKMIFVFFDFIAALAIYKIIEVYRPNGKTKFIAAYSFLFAPTVFITSGLWGQSDVIYTAFLLWSFFFILRNRFLLAFVLFAISFSFKLQAIFFAPIFIILFLHKKFPFYYFFSIPIVYFLSIVPAWLAGGPLVKLLRIYFSQAQNHESILSLNAPNIFIFIPPQPQIEIKILIGLIAAGLFTFIYILIRWQKWKLINCYSLTFDVVVFTTLIPFLLPKMHERYFFVASVFLIILAIFNNKFISLALLIQTSSLLSYIPYLANWRSLSVFPKIGASINIILILGLIYFNNEYRSTMINNNESLQDKENNIPDSELSSI